MTRKDMICHNYVDEVTVRTFEVDKQGIVNLLRNNKTMSNKEIAKKLCKPITLVEHWFRTDVHFAIPDVDSWKKLKGLLNITDDSFDDQVTMFETKEAVFEKSGRIYGFSGISPTVTTLHDIKVIRIWKNKRKC